MPTNKQRRQAAQRRLQRQLERRQVQARRRRRNLLAIVTLAAVAAVVIAGVVIAGLGGSTKKASSAAGSSSPASATSAAPAGSSAAASSSSAAPSRNADGTAACSYLPAQGSNLKNVGTPPTPDHTPTQGTATLKMNTNQGVITLNLDRSKAPCAAASFVYLAGKGFFDPSPCHREVNQPTFGVLQCGDPSGTGQGGPTYTFAQEVTAQTKYPRGTIAMANTGQPNSTGSQFFLCFTDTDLSPDYTAVGTVDQAGLAVLDKIAAAGNDGSFEPSPGGGKPKVPVNVTSIDVS